EHAAHGFGGEPSGEQEAGLASALGERDGCRAEAALPDRAGTLELGSLERGGVRLHQRFVEPVRAHFVADRRSAVALGAPMHQRFGETLVRQQPRRGEFVEQGLDLLGAFGMGGELAAELGATVLAPREQAQRARLQRDADLRAVGGPVARAAAETVTRRLQAAASSGAAPRAATPKCARTLFSISSDSSGCSRRYSRALSLPWPMRSPP